MTTPDDKLAESSSARINEIDEVCVSTDTKSNVTAGEFDHVEEMSVADENASLANEQEMEDSNHFIPDYGGEMDDADAEHSSS